MFTIDTNILIYSTDSRDLRKQTIADRIVHAQVAKKFPVPLQSLSEFYAAVTGKSIIPSGDAAAIISYIMSNCAVYGAQDIDLPKAIRLQQAHQVQFYDALLLVTAARMDCTTLFSEDMQHGRDYGGITVRNPFVMDEAELNALLG
jgi:predicted nucleic acid-binding protein